MNEYYYYLGGAIALEIIKGNWFGLIYISLWLLSYYALPSLKEKLEKPQLELLMHYMYLSCYMIFINVIGDLFSLVWSIFFYFGFVPTMVLIGITISFLDPESDNTVGNETILSIKKTLFSYLTFLRDKITAFFSKDRTDFMYEKLLQYWQKCKELHNELSNNPHSQKILKQLSSQADKVKEGAVNQMFDMPVNQPMNLDPDEDLDNLDGSSMPQQMPDIGQLMGMMNQLQNIPGFQQQMQRTARDPTMMQQIAQMQESMGMNRTQRRMMEKLQKKKMK